MSDEDAVPSSGGGDDVGESSSTSAAAVAATTTATTTAAAAAAAAPASVPAAAAGATQRQQQQQPPVDKVKVHFVAVGSAPILKKSKFQINADQRFAAVTAFLRKVLKLSDTQQDSANNSSGTTTNHHQQQLSGSSLFLYVNSAFVPGPEERVGDLRDCFSVRDELVVHYSLQEAWG